MPTVVESAPPASARAATPVHPLALRCLWMLVIFFCSVLIADMLRLGGCAYLAYALAGSFAVHWQERRSLRELAEAVGWGGAYFAAYSAMRGPFHPYVGWWAGTAAGFAGLGSLLVLFIRGAEAEGPERKKICATLERAAVVPALCAVSLLAVLIGVRLAPHTWDYTLYSFDRRLGVNTFAVGSWLSGSALLFGTCALVYHVLPLYICATLMTMWRRGRWRTVTMMAVTLGAIGFLAYQICPAAGPLYSFPGMFPWSSPSAVSFPPGAAAAPDGLRNAMPSLHIGFALLCYWNLGPLGRWFRLGSAVYLFVTAVATIGFGEHYFIDLVVAVPLALAVYGGWRQEADRKRRIVVASIGGLITVCWLIGLRTGVVPGSGEMAWLAVFATLTGALGLKHWVQVSRCELIDSSSRSGSDGLLPRRSRTVRAT